MSTTEIMLRIQADLKNDNSLQRYLPELVKSLNSLKPFVSSNMNAKQQLTQLQSLIHNELKLIQNQLKAHQIDLQAQQQPQEQPIEDDQSQQMQLESQENQGQEKGEEEAYQYDGDLILQDNQGEDQEQIEFAEPDFQKSKLKKHSKQQQNQMDQENLSESNLQLDKDQSGQQNDQEALQEQDDQDAFDGEEDVGLYGQELNSNDQDLENYQNQFDQQQYKQFEKEFGQPENKKSKKSKSKQPNLDQQDQPDYHIEDNFDHFRQIQLENQKAENDTRPKTQLDNQIDRLQQKIITKKSWTMKGQVKARQRPANSLLEYDLQFNSGIKYSHEITEQRNTQLEELIKKRILSDMFDDRTRFVNASHIRQHFGSLKQVSRQKSKMGLGQVYESQFKNFLGIGQNKNDKLKTQIMDSFKQLNYYLDSLSNFSFVPKPTKESTKKGQSEAIIVEEKVPLTLWNGQKQVQKDKKYRFESQKQVDNQAKRLKNKRIARQRKKQQIKKKLNKKIEYGGTTKFLAQANQKAMMNNKPLLVDGVNMKYNKSTSFFKNINQNKGGKPNPDISKMKI